MWASRPSATTAEAASVFACSRARASRRRGSSRAEAHHVGGGEQTTPPEARDAVPAHKAQHRIIGRAQPAICFDPEWVLGQSIR
jgi:hypothetical protein